MQTVRMNFLYRQGSVMFFMDPVSFEQIELDVSLAPGNAAYYLIGQNTMHTTHRAHMARCSS